MTHAHSRILAILALSTLATSVLAQPNPVPGQTIPGGPAIALGIVRGEVTDGASPVPNARMTVLTPSLSYFREARTNTLGKYAIKGVPPGTYRLGVAAIGYAYQEIEIQVSGVAQHDFSLSPETEPGRWDIIGNTLPEFFDATDIGFVMPDGKLFYCHDTRDPILFDPVTGQKSFPADSGTAQGCMNGTLLADGRVIMVGGQDGADPGNFVFAVRWVKTYTHATDTWQQLPDLQHPTGRWYPGLARLADGSLLAMGGGTCCAAVRTDTCERFDLNTQTWAYTGSMENPTEFPPCALLYTGEVLATWWPPQLYNPDTEQWRLTGNFVQPQRGWPGHSDHSLVVLADGRALALGVSGAANSFMGEIYDPLSESWTATSNPDLIRFQTEVVQLPDGRILAAGGEAKNPNPPVEHVLGIVKWSDVYDPGSNTWRRVADMNWFREYHAVTLLLPDARVAMTGGTRIKFQYGPTSADIEAFVPPYLFRGVRPQITSISATQVPRGAQLTLNIFPATKLTSVVLMGVQSTTHWVDAGVPRRLVLPVQQVGSTATMTLPVNPNVLPLGRYMVFTMVDDIPSVARVVEVY